MGNRIGYPHQLSAWYWVEASYGGGASGTTYHISDSIVDARLESGEVNIPLWGANSTRVAEFLKTVKDPTLHLEWIPQPASDALIDDCIDRTNGDIDNLAFCIGASTTSTNSSYFYLKGVKCKVWNADATRGSRYVCSADFSVQSVATSTASTGSPAPASFATDYAVFNVAGGIYKNTSAAIAFITDSIHVTVDNHLTDYWDSDSQYKQYALPGRVEITGSCDISLDEGGAVHFSDVSSAATFANITVNMGYGKTLSLSTAIWDPVSIDQSVTDTGMMTSQSFKAMAIT